MSTIPPTQPPGLNPAPPSVSPPPSAPISLRRVAVVVAILIVCGLLAGWLPRLRARRALAEETRKLNVATVQIVLPQRAEADLSEPLPAEIRAYFEAPIYARASGYLKRWVVDIGAQVRKDDLLAEIDTPELDEQLAQAKAELAQASAALDLARTTAARWRDLLKTASVSEQETAEKEADLELKEADVQGARANVSRLEALKGFAQVTAPFAGTITARETDVGQLVSASNGKELFRLAQLDPLRVYVQVPQNQSRAIAVGQKAELILNEMAGRKFDAHVVRTAGAIEPMSRTLLTELEVNNSRGEILAGSYAQVRFTDTVGEAALTLPANTLLFRKEGLQVAVVDPTGRVHLQSIKLGRDFGQKVEILAGVDAHDHVIMNPSDSLTSGDTVHIAESPDSVAEK